MNEWWLSLDLLQKVFTILAVPATVILVLQSILLLFGMGDHDVDIDAGGDIDGLDGMDLYDGGSTDGIDGSDGIALFSIRGIMAFFAVGGWTGVVVAGTGIPAALSIFIALLAGTAALVGFAYLMKAMMKLQSSGNLDLQNAVGKTAKVYLTVPAGRRDLGKVTLTVQDRFIECEAMTDVDESLKTGTLVTVAGVIGDTTLLVRPLAEPVHTQEA